METTKVLWAKKEDVYAEDATPTAAANAALTRNFQAKPVVVDRIARNVDSGVRGRTKDAPSNERQTFGYELELAGSGAAGTAAAWMEHLEACGMAAPTLTAGQDAVQAFAAVGTPLSSVTAYHWDGPMRRRGVGARGTFGWDVTAGQYPFLKLDMTALLLKPTPIDQVAPGVPDLSRWIDPVEVHTDNTDFMLDGFALVLRSFTGDVNADVKARNLVGANYIQRGNHAITGRIVGEVPDLAAKNYFDTLRSGDEVPLALTHGTVAGNIVSFAAAHLQITDIDLQEEDDVLMLQIAYPRGTPEPAPKPRPKVPKARARSSPRPRRRPRRRKATASRHRSRSPRSFPAISIAAASTSSMAIRATRRLMRPSPPAGRSRPVPAAHPSPNARSRPITSTSRTTPW